MLEFVFDYGEYFFAPTALIFYYLNRLRKRYRSIKSKNASVLLTYYTDGATLVPLAKGKIAGLQYYTFLNQQTNNDPFDIADSIVYQVELPFKSRVHLVGIPKSKHVAQLDPTRFDSIMEEVLLEGDYPSHFSLFAERQMQTETRYVLDPKAMVFTIEFCKSHNWEIVDSTLYFLQAGKNHKNDPTFMSEDIEQFIEEIRPAVEKPLTEADVIRRTPYGEERRELECPFCKAVLTNNAGLLSCPNKHGLLTTGKNLKKLKFTKNHKSQESLEKDQHQLVCPGCKSKMKKVKYNGGSTVIDSCSKCPYRWLDKDEFESS